MDRPRRSRRLSPTRPERPAAGRRSGRDRAVARPRRAPPRRRRSPVGIIVLVVVLVAVGIGLMIFIRRSKDEETLADAMAEVQRNVAEVLRKVAADPMSAPDNQSGLLENQARLLQERSRETGGRVAKIMRAMASFFRDEAVILKRYETAYGAFEAAGGMAPDGLDSRERIASRRRLVDGLRKANAKLMAFFDEMEDVMAGHLAREGLDEASRAEIRRSLLAALSGRIQSMRTVRGMDEELCDLIDEMLNLLEAQLGKWELDAGMVRFESDAAVETFNELVQEVQKVAQRQLAAQRAMARSMLSRMK